MYIKKPKTMLDLNKVKQIIFDDICILLDDLELEYAQVADNIIRAFSNMASNID